MAVYRIVEIGDPVLREKSIPVSKVGDNITKLLKNMADTMYSDNGVGLAAPQIGISKRVIVVDDGSGLIEMINPEIVAAEGEATDTEGCLSLPGLVAEVKRAYKVKVKGLNGKGEEQVIEAEDLLARIFQHEIDHLDGILIVDKAIRVSKKK